MGNGADILNGDDGQDLIKGEAGNDTLNGGTGHDTLQGGDGDDALNGDAGNDVLQGGAGIDTLYGGAGADKLEGGTEGDFIYGEGDNDKLYGNEGDDTLNGGDGHDKLFGGNGADILDGETGNDTIYGDAGVDTLYGRAGNDKLFGGDDGDTLFGGTGNDKLFGQGGNDTLNGEDGNDRISGGDGIDTINGGAGIDNIDGDAGNDIISGGDAGDLIKGGDGDDVINGDAGEDNLYGQAGNDTINGGDESDYLYGKEGNDILNGDNGADLLRGGEDNDTLNGGEGNDVLNGEDGVDILDGGIDDDILIGGSGADTLTGGTGNDTLHGHGLWHRDVQTILNANPDVVFYERTNSFYQFVNITGNTLAEATGLAQGTLLNGVAGHLVNVTSQAENDFVSDLITGRAWAGASDEVQEGEWIWQSGAEAGIQFWEGALGGTAVNNMYDSWATGPNNGGSGQDGLSVVSTGVWDDIDTSATYTRTLIEWDAGLINDDNAIDTLNGGAGNDTLYGYGGNDILDGGADNDILIGGEGDDDLTGGAGDDALFGQNGNDTLNGGDGADTLDGGGGDDTLTAGDGNDTIYGDGLNSRQEQINQILNDNPSVVYNEQSNSFYQLVTAGANFNTSKANANATLINGVGGHLSNITSLAENTFIDSLIVADTWIGGSDSAAEGVWVWEEGKEAGDQFWAGAAAGSSVGGYFENWAGGEPNDYGSGEDHVTIRTNGTWNDLRGTNSRDYLIEWNAEDVIDTSAAGDDIINGGDGDDTIYGDYVSSIITGTAQGWAYEYYDLPNTPSNLATAGFTLNGGRDNTNTVTTTGITQNTDPNTFDTGDNYALKFTTTLTVTTGGTYIFRTASDDGSQLFLDGVQIVDNDGLHGVVTVTSAGQVLTAGTYTLETTFFERGGGNVLDVTMSGPDTGGSFINLENYAGVSVSNVGPSSEGLDTIAGGLGTDILYGGGGADTFVFEATSAFAQTDTVMDFSTLDGDALDIADLLTNWLPGHVNRGDITNYIRFTNSAGDTVVEVDANGSSGGTGFQTVAILDNLIGLDEVTLFNNGNIIV